MLRDKKVKKVNRIAGGKNLLHVYYTFGRSDVVAVNDMPSRESVMKFIFEDSSGRKR
jgi:uncharacterized protein with GYD domain